MEHKLKCWPAVFKSMVNGEKTFEYRKNDRDYKLGDTLLLQEYNTDINEYSGKELSVKVTYIIYGGQFGIPEGYCIMGVQDYGTEAMTEVCSEIKAMPQDELEKHVHDADREYRREKCPYIPPVTCVRCGKELKALDPSDPIDYGVVESGIVGRLYSPYGSENDGTIYQIGICDPCIKEVKLKEIGDYMNPDIDTAIKHEARIKKFHETGTYTVGGKGQLPTTKVVGL